YAAMHVGAPVRGEPCHGFDDLERHLRRRRIIEINDFLSAAWAEGRKHRAIETAARSVIFRTHCRERVYAAPHVYAAGRGSATGSGHTSMGLFSSREGHATITV